MQEPTCRVIRSDDTYYGKQGLTYAAGVCTETAGSKAICLHHLEMPPGVRGKAHYHEEHESAIYVLEGEAGMLYGDRLEHNVHVRAGDYIYIPAGVPHLPYNLSETKAVKAVIARTDPNEQESVVLCPELDEVARRN